MRLQKLGDHQNAYRYILQVESLSLQRRTLVEEYIGKHDALDTSRRPELPVHHFEANPKNLWIMLSFNYLRQNQ